MSKNVKRSVTLSIITLCLLVVLLAGSTYALFTDSVESSIIVSSAKVDVKAEITNYQTYSLGVEQDPNGSFELGGVAILDQTANGDFTGSLELINVAPGDKVAFTIKVTNDSTISVLRRFRIVSESDNGLLAGLVVTVDGVAYTVDALANDNAWVEVTQTGVTNIDVTIELPVAAGNEYQDKTCTLQVLIDVVQGNADASSEWQNYLNTVN